MATKQLLLAARSEAVTAAIDRELAELVHLVGAFQTHTTHD